MLECISCFEKQSTLVPSNPPDASTSLEIQQNKYRLKLMATDGEITLMLSHWLMYAQNAACQPSRFIHANNSKAGLRTFAVFFF